MEVLRERDAASPRAVAGLSCLGKWLWVKAVLGSLFGVGALPILVYFSGDWDVHWGYWILTHGQIRMVWVQIPGCGMKGLSPLL